MELPREKQHGQVEVRDQSKKINKVYVAHNGTIVEKK
jgi:hypothetical protein